MLSSARQLGREGPEQMKASKATCTRNGWLLPQASQGPKVEGSCSEGETQPKSEKPQWRRQRKRGKR